MSDVIPFDFEGSAVRVITREGAPWFVLADVCRVLEISNVSQAATRLDDDEKDGVITNDPIGRQQTATVISESGFYSLVLTSRKEAAKRFKKWVTAEVLPSIRRTGGYQAPAKVEPAGQAVPAGRVVPLPDKLLGFIGTHRFAVAIILADFGSSTHNVLYRYFSSVVVAPSQAIASANAAVDLLRQNPKAILHWVSVDVIPDEFA